MTAFVVILAALQLAVPVRCYETPAAWEAHKAEALAPTAAAAFYMPAATAAPYIALGPKACRNVRRATDWGAFVLGHELAHQWQDNTGRPFDEAEADRIGWARLERWKTRLRVFFHVPGDPPAVRLTG